jgi:hypothetical protein
VCNSINLIVIICSSGGGGGGGGLRTHREFD